VKLNDRSVDYSEMKSSTEIACLAQKLGRKKPEKRQEWLSCSKVDWEHQHWLMAVYLSQRMRPAVFDVICGQEQHPHEERHLTRKPFDLLL
jgi:hypothetical protein